MGEGLGSTHGTRRPAHRRDLRTQRCQPQSAAALRDQWHPAGAPQNGLAVSDVRAGRACRPGLCEASEAAWVPAEGNQGNRRHSAVWERTVLACAHARGTKGDRARQASERCDAGPRSASGSPEGLVVETTKRRRRVPSHRIRQRHDAKEDAMESVKMSLCPACTACPEVEIAGDEVRIGEAGNLAVLKRKEWNVLV